MSKDTEFHTKQSKELNADSKWIRKSLSKKDFHNDAISTLTPEIIENIQLNIMKSEKFNSFLDYEVSQMNPTVVIEIGPIRL